MVLTVLDVVKDALDLAGVTEIDEVPSGSDTTVAIRTINIMLDRWSTQNLLLRSDTTISFNLSANKASYTIGPSGQEVTAAKPIKINSGYVRDANTDYPLEVVSKSLYDAQWDKLTSSGLPTMVAYDPGAAQQSNHFGTVYFHLKPERVYTAYLEASTYLTEFTGASQTVTFDPAYYEAIVYNAAVRLFRHFHDSKAVIPGDILSIAETSLSNLKNMNSTTLIATFDMPGSGGGRYNAYNDDFN